MYEMTDVCHEFLEGNLGEQRLVCEREECVYHTADKKPTLQSQDNSFCFVIFSLIEHDNPPENERLVYNCTSDANVNASTVRYVCAVSCIITKFHLTHYTRQTDLKVD